MDEEKALEAYILKTSKMFYGFTKLQARQLAYKFAKTKNIRIPNNWIKNEAAGEDWLCGFRRRSGNLSLRNPESTSLARSMGFNRPAVNAFFTNLREVLLRGDYAVSPQNIWNLDETGISTVVKPGKILAEKGVKQVGRTSSSERGVMVTMCCCINAIGNSLPPVYIFPRVHFKNHMLRGAPAGSCGLARVSGWMTSDLFPEALAHFIKFMSVSKDNPGVLLMDNHISHLSLDAIDMAKENGLSLLTFPPHCSHKLQPLDVGVYGPFKRYYSSLCDAWMSSNPGKPITIYNVAELSGQAFQRSFTIENITSSFKSSGIHPYNADIFTDDVFLPSLVTDIPLQQGDDDASCVPTTSGLSVTSICASSPSTADSHDSDDVALLTTISPYPKADVTRKRPSKNRCKSAIITDTPEKENILSRRKKLPAKRQKRTVSSSSESEISVHLVSDSESGDDSRMSGISKIPCNPTPTQHQLEIGDFAIIKVYSAEGKYRNFIGKICDGPDEDGDYEVNFMRQSQKIRDGFQFPEEIDAASISLQDIIQVLPQPSSVAATKRLCGIFKFGADLSPYGL